MEKKINILFVCKHNMFRSKIAEIYFDMINKNKNINADSAGIIRGYYPLDKREVAAAKELGINLSGRPKGLSIDLIKKQNLIIIVANDVTKNIFDRKEYINFKTTKIIVWKVEDNLEATNFSKLKEIIKKIMKKVEELNKKLEKTR